MAKPPNIPTDDVSDVDLSGRRFGDYRILSRLGHGAMAVVYLAEQTSLQRQVALKVLKRSLKNDVTYIKRFQNEARAAAALVHANIVQIYEVGCIEEIHYIAQEYVSGQNLGQLLAQSGSPDLKLAIAIMCQVAAALAKSGEQGIVHRDIKPENILLAQNGEIKVADFGLARITEIPASEAGPGRSASLELTKTGITMGTPLYMSPEQVQGKTLDPRSDIYSFGVTCYHMLTGQPPFRGETPLDVAVQHINKQPEEIGSVRPDLPPELCHIIHKMLAKDPGQRYTQARDLLRELRSLRIEESDSPGELDGDLDGDLASRSARWSGTQKGATRDARTKAVSQLGTLMMTTSTATIRRRFVKLLIAGCVAAFLIGALISWIANKSPEPPLLPKPKIQAKP